MKQEKGSKKMERIEPVAFQALHQKEDITILDVREVDEFQAGHIEGALNVPLSTLDKGYEQLDASKRYYVICKAVCALSVPASSWRRKALMW